MTTCRKCHNDYQPTANQIRKHDYICLGCRRLYDGAWRERRKALGLPASGSRTWDPEKYARYKAIHYAKPEVKSKKAAQMRSYRSKPELRQKHEARWQLNRAVASGKITKQPCKVCGDPKSQGHHSDYSQPLSVTWLCRKHHTELHARAEGLRP